MVLCKFWTDINDLREDHARTAADRHPRILRLSNVSFFLARSIFGGVVGGIISGSHDG